MGKRQKKRSANKGMIYLIPHTHYDAIWVFTKDDYFYINIEMILKKVIDMLDKTKKFKFTIEQRYLIEEIEKFYPKIYNKLKKYLKQGRIEIADGEYLMADTMRPTGETLIREIMFGKEYVKWKFNKRVDVMWQADSFGLNAQLPQIYKKSKYKYVAFRRGNPKRNPSEFMWEGLDGTRILTHFMPLGYRAGFDLRKLEKSYKNLKGVAATSNVLMPSGSGVTMPQKETIPAVNKWNRKHRVKMKIGVPSEFFKALEKNPKKWAVRKGEMFSGRYSEVFPDVASSRAWVKQDLRKYENLLLTFEKFSAILCLFTRCYNQYVRKTWKRILFMAVHDGVPGTGMDSAYKEVRENVKILDKRINRLLPEMLQSINNANSGNASGEIAVFNPLSWDVSNWVETDLKFRKGKVKAIKGLISEDNKISVEILKSSKHKDGSFKNVKIGFIANAPPVGYRVYKIARNKVQENTDSFLKVKKDTIENKFFKLNIDKENGLIEVFKDNKKIFDGNQISVEEEIGDLYYHKESIGTPLKTESGEGLKYGSFKVKKLNIDKSDLRAVINIETDYYSLRWPYRRVDVLKPLIWRHCYIKFKKKIIIYRDIPRIDCVVNVDNEHPRIRLRVKFNANVKNKKYVCESQFGAVKRNADEYHLKPKGWVEKPSGVTSAVNWLDYGDNEKGLTIINKGNPENEVRDGNVYLTLLRAVDLVSSDGKAGPMIPVPKATEYGTNIFHYSIYPHLGDWKSAKSYKHGYEYNSSLIPVQLQQKSNYMSQRSFVKIEPVNVIVSAIKKADESDYTIIRFYEAEGKDTNTAIILFKKPKEVSEVNLLEEIDKEYDKKLIVEDNTIRLRVKPFEIVTLRLKI
jgi:alpha-mannosidase